MPSSLLILLILLCSASEAAALRNYQEGQSLNKLAGLEALTIAQLTGHKTILVFLRAGQSQSLKAAKDLSQLVGKNKKLKIFALISSKEPLKLEELKTEFGQKLKFIGDKDYLFYRQLGITVLPTTIVLNKKRQLIKIYPGHTPNYLDRLKKLTLNKSQRLSKEEENKDPMLTIHRDLEKRHLIMAKKLAEKGLYGAAIAEYDKYLAKHPEHEAIRRKLIKVLIDDKQLSRAKRELTKLKKKNKPYFKLKKLIEKKEQQPSSSPRKRGSSK